jgi:hypothetical protein
MGRKTNLSGNPDLGKEHKVGAQIAVIQILAHAQLGAIAYPWPRFWALHANLADEAFTRLESVHDQVLALPTDTSNMRSIHDLPLLQEIYGAGSEMVSNAVRAVQHLSEEMERVKGSVLTGSTVEERIRAATGMFGLDSRTDSPEYQGLIEILAIRDAIEHPKEANVYQGDENRWDEVPLAWMISDRSLKAFNRFSEWFGALVDEWEQCLLALPVERATLAVTRGIESKLQAKKGPKGPR